MRSLIHESNFNSNLSQTNKTSVVFNEWIVSKRNYRGITIHWQTILNFIYFIFLQINLPTWSKMSNLSKRYKLIKGDQTETERKGDQKWTINALVAFLRVHAIMTGTCLLRNERETAAVKYQRQALRCRKGDNSTGLSSTAEHGQTTVFTTDRY